MRADELSLQRNDIVITMKYVFVTRELFMACPHAKRDTYTAIGYVRLSLHLSETLQYFVKQLNISLKFFRRHFTILSTQQLTNSYPTKFRQGHYIAQYLENG